MLRSRHGDPTQRTVWGLLEALSLAIDDLCLHVTNAVLDPLSLMSHAYRPIQEEPASIETGSPCGDSALPD